MDVFQCRIQKNKCEGAVSHHLFFSESSSTGPTSALYKYDPVVTTTTSKFPIGGGVVENCVSTTANAVTTATTAPNAMPGRRTGLSYSHCLINLSTGTSIYDVRTPLVSCRYLDPIHALKFTQPPLPRLFFREIISGSPLNMSSVRGLL